LSNLEAAETHHRLRNAVLLPVSVLWSLAVLLFVAATNFAGLRAVHLFSDGRIGPAAFGALVAHAILCASDRRKRMVLRIGAGLEILRIVALLRAGVAADAVAFSVGYGFLAAALADFLIHREWRSAALAALVPIGMASAPLGLAGIVRKHTPLTYDGALMAFDSTLRIPFTRLSATLIDRVAAVRALTLIAYAALPGAIAAGLAYEEYTIRKNINRGAGVNLLLAYTISGTLAAILYMICPATGPYHAFRDAFPLRLPDALHVPLALSPFAPDSPRNAMPSLHVAWAVMLARSTAGARKSLRAAAWLYALLTILATVGSGEHYVFDLIATAPFLIALEAATARRIIAQRRRVLIFVAGLALYSLWIIAIRNAPSTIPVLASSPVLVWTLVVATLAISAVLALRHGQLEKSAA
jgi:hypothetical protein